MAEGKAGSMIKTPRFALMQLGSKGAARQLGGCRLSAQPLHLARARALQPVQPLRCRQRFRMSPRAYKRRI